MKLKPIIGGVVVVALIIGVVLGVQFVAALWRINHHAESEYPTAEAIREVTSFVESHNGDWPTSWNDLNFPVDQREHVNLRFDVTAEKILADPDLIYHVIEPVTGPFRIYPHSKSDLEYLRDRIEEMRLFHRNKTE